MIIHEIAQGSDEWFALRAGIPTASEFSKIVTSKGDLSKSISGYAATLAGEYYAGKPLDRWEGNQHTERGNELEPVARSNYEFDTDAEVQLIGFVTNFNAGCSPDALAGDVGLLEIKCPTAKVHVETHAYVAKHNKCPTTYVAQTQGQMLICEREWCDLMFYHPELPSLTIRQYRDEGFIRGLMVGISAVIAERDRFLEILNSK